MGTTLINKIKRTLHITFQPILLIAQKHTFNPLNITTIFFSRHFKSSGLQRIPHFTTTKLTILSLPTIITNTACAIFTLSVHTLKTCTVCTINHFNYEKIYYSNTQYVPKVPCHLELTISATIHDVMSPVCTFPYVCG